MWLRRGAAAAGCRAPGRGRRTPVRPGSCSGWCRGCRPSPRSRTPGPRRACRHRSRRLLRREAPCSAADVAVAAPLARSCPFSGTLSQSCCRRAAEQSVSELDSRCGLIRRVSVFSEYTPGRCRHGLGSATFGTAAVQALGAAATAGQSLVPSLLPGSGDYSGGGFGGCPEPNLRHFTGTPADAASILLAANKVGAAHRRTTEATSHASCQPDLDVSLAFFSGRLRPKCRRHLDHKNRVGSAALSIGWPPARCEPMCLEAGRH